MVTRNCYLLHYWRIHPHLAHCSYYTCSHQSNTRWESVVKVFYVSFFIFHIQDIYNRLVWCIRQSILHRNHRLILLQLWCCEVLICKYNHRDRQPRSSVCMSDWCIELYSTTHFHLSCFSDRSKRDISPLRYRDISSVLVSQCIQ